MPAGNSNIIQAPWPHGLLILKTGTFTVANAQTHVVDFMTIPYKSIVRRIEMCGYAYTSGPTLAVVDEESSPQTVCTGAIGGTTWAVGAATTTVVIPTANFTSPRPIIKPMGTLKFTVVTTTGLFNLCHFNLWLEPLAG